MKEALDASLSLCLVVELNVMNAVSCAMTVVLHSETMQCIRQDSILVLRKRAYFLLSGNHVTPTYKIAVRETTQ